jgi:hypothetical protein
MRVLISTKFLGGIGGSARSVASTIRALAADEVDVCAMQKAPGPFSVEPVHGRIVRRLGWRYPSDRRRVLSRVWPGVFPLVRYRPHRYDAYLHFFGAAYLGDRFDARTRFLIPKGKDLRGEPHRFDLVLLEAPANRQYLGDASNAVVLPPPLFEEATSSEAIPRLPREFLLTVFNPHGGVKGQSLLEVVGPMSPLPIVWCHSRRTIPPVTIRQIPNVIFLEDPTQAQLRFLYDNCVAYVSFSHDEGFGWAIADALQYGTPIISRRVGVLTIEGIDLRSVHTYDELDELIALVETPPSIRVRRVLDVLRPEAYREGLMTLVV